MSGVMPSWHGMGQLYLYPDLYSGQAYVGLLCASNHNTKTGQATYIQHNTDAGSSNHCFSGKPISIKHSDCVSAALVTQQAMHMPHIVICDLPDVQYFSTLSHKWHRV